MSLPHWQTVLVCVLVCTAVEAQTTSGCRSAPQVAWATYLGGSAFEHARDVATDAAGNVYVTGGTMSADFPATNRIVNSGVTESGADNMDIFVTKMSPSGTVIWSTRIGGPNYDRAYAIEIDPAGSIVLAGRAGRGFPVTAGAFQSTFKGGMEAAFYGNQDGIVFKLSADGQNLLWASYFGTEDPRIIRDAAVDENGDILLASARGSGTWVSNVAGAFRNQPAGGIDGVIAKVTGDGSRVLWAWYVGGSADETGQPAVRVDPAAGIWYLTSTRSADARTTPGALQRQMAGGTDFYLTRWSRTGTLLAATYVGGSSDEMTETHNLAVDGGGNAYIAASTLSRNFPVTVGAFARNHAGNGGTGSGARTNYAGDGVIAKVAANGTRLLASTFIGGRFGDAVEGVDIDDRGYVHVTGGTYSDNFPVSASAYQRTFKSTIDSFYAQLSPDLSTLVYSTYIGGGQEAGRAMTLDSHGAAYLAGEVAAAGFPLLNAAQSSYAGSGDGFVVKIASGSFSSPCASPGAVVNSASYLAGIVPGSLVSLFGTGLLRGVSGTLHAGGTLSVNGTSIAVGGIRSPILSLTSIGSEEQINFQAPFEITGRSTVDVEVNSSGTLTRVSGVPVLAAQPGIFEWTAADGTSHGAVVRDDGSLVSAAAPARTGEVLSVFLTGGGPLTTTVGTGVAGPVPPATMVLPVKVQVNGVDCDVLFAGYAPDFIGLYQLNFSLRQAAPSGEPAALTVTVGNVVSPATLVDF